MSPVRPTIAEEESTVAAVPGIWSYEALDNEKVKWYYLRTPLSLKAVYGQDILHRADIQRFCTTDSKKLEAAFRAEQDELEKVWWEEHVDIGTSLSMPTPGGSSPQSNLPDKDSSSATWQDYHLGKDKDTGLLVRGGLYEAHLRHRRLDTCYWPEPSHRLLRGTWFLEKAPDWVPLKEATADELEEAYRSEIWSPTKEKLSTQKAGVQAARVNLQTLQNEAKGWFASFVSATEAYLCKDDSFSWLSRKLSSKAAAPGYRLRRGYEAPPENVVVREADPKAEEADEAAARLPVSKLLLVVHGIGQNLAGSNIAEDAALVRQGLMSHMAEQGGEEDDRGRVEVLPVQWRKHLNLDVDKLADTLMPPGIRSLRTMLHATAVEVLLYVTPLHCQEVLDSIVQSLNLQYRRFMKRNPEFKGEVSLLAHSLGSVLCYDVLCNQSLHSVSSKMDEDQYPVEETNSESLAKMDLQPSVSPLKPLSSVDLDPARAPMENTTPFETIFEASHSSCGQSQPLWGTNFGSSSESQGSELLACRREIARLKKELKELREKRHRAALQPEFGAEPMSNQNQPLLSTSISVKELDFTVDRFIAIGSPLGIFLTLRKVNPLRGQGLGSREAAGLMVGEAAKHGDGLPAAQRMYNLYHPFDPVGFRLEPLITAGAEKRRPVFASTGKGSRTIGVGLTEFGEDVSAAVSLGAAKASAIFRSSLSTLRLSSLSKKQETTEEEAPDSEDRKLSEKEEAAEVGVQAASRATQSAVWRLTDGPGQAATYPPSRSAQGRLDFVLQSGITENQWLSAMSSHFSYWNSPDVALFVMRALFHHDVHLGVKSSVQKETVLKDKRPSSPLGNEIEHSSRGHSLDPGIVARKSEFSTLSLPSSPTAMDLLSPTGQKSSKSTSVMRGKGDPEDWW